VQREPARVARIADRLEEVDQVDQPDQVAVAALEDAEQVVGQPGRPGAGLGPGEHGGLDAKPAIAGRRGAVAAGLAGQAAGQHQRLACCGSAAGQGGPAGTGV
jgi:hypothetical protein